MLRRLAMTETLAEIIVELLAGGVFLAPPTASCECE